MIKKILAFELKSRFTQWITLLFILMMIFQGLWYTKGYYDFYGGDGMWLNSAGVAYQNLAGCGLLMIIIVAVITGPTLYKDIQYKSAGWMYALPVNEKQFFLGRFLAAFLINVLIALFYIVGLLLVPYSGLGSEDMMGPTPIGQMFHGFFILTVPNLFLLTSLCFAALAIFKKPAAGYLVIFMTVISFLFMQTNAETSGFTTLNLTADAFGFVPVSQQIMESSIPERNTGYIELSGTLLFNRVLWFSIALIMLVIAYFKFSFKEFVALSKKRKKAKLQPTTLANVATATTQTPTTEPSLIYTSAAFLKKLWSLSKLEFKTIVRPMVFRIIVGILVVMAILQHLIWNASFYIGPQVPTTSAMTDFRVTNGVFIIILLIIWSGELFFKDKTVNIWQITDALPVPVWVTQLSKLFAMLGVAFVINFVFMLTGIFAQIVQGGASTIDMGLFINDYLGYNWGWINHCFYIILTFFVAGLTGNRFLTHILSAGYFFVMLMGFEFGLIEDLRHGFGFTPGFEDYSEINGYGMWRSASFWYFLMWLTLAVAFVLMGILFWDRGLAQGILKKLRFQSTQLRLFGKLSIPLFLAAFVFLQSFIFKQVNGNDNFELSSEEEISAADYERTYSYLQNQPHPKYSQLNFAIDFFPEERRAVYEAKAELTNSSDQAIDTLYLNLPGHTELLNLNYQNQTLTPSKIDDNHDLVLFVLPTPLDTNATVAITLKMEKDFEGFTQGEPQAALVYNGSFGTIDDYLPFIGYDDDRRLEENRARAEQNLPKLTSLLPDLEDENALKENSYRSDAFPMSGTLTISTSKAQTPIGTGNLSKSWEENDRNYATFNIPTAEPLHWQLGSSGYELFEGNKNIEIYYRKEHFYNVELYHTILQKGINFIEKHLESYPYETVRLYEIPRYQEAVYAFNRGIAISELEGWIADTSGIRERAYLHHTVATALAKHWVQHHLSIANVQGSDMLSIALPEALALHFVEQNFGEEGVASIRESKMKIYNKERFNDPNGEPPLLHADGKDYLEANLGALVLYDWSREMGLEQFSEEIEQLKDQKALTFKTFYQSLLARTKVEKREQWTSLVELTTE
ncbi:MAG: ABC transporter permease [Bacteroidota bacterium]